ncbi:MAG: DUF2520 domain-containing protein [Actinobacteria bacterium]|nr:DUF2520 domain-containing protein [Actinomycetota bacterium]
MKVALVGAGNVGTAVAALLARKDHEIVAVASRSPESAAAASKRLGADVYAVDELPQADLILLGVPDAALEPVSAKIAGRVSGGAYVWHFAGSFGPSVLDAVVDNGAIGCATHPVQACPTVDAAIARLPGSAWGVTCSDPAAEVRIVELIDRDLDGYALVLPEEVRSIWHAAAVATSNGLAAVLATGETILADIDIDDPMRVLGPLAEGTLQNAREGGGGAATLTGPVVRGEKETVRRHVNALRDRPGPFMQYRAAAFLIVQAAVAAGRIDEQTAEEIMAEFGR